MIGTFGEVVFQVTSNKMRTPKGLSRSGSARYQQHDIVGRKPVLEFLGAGIDTVTYSVRLDASMGIKPYNEIKALREYRDTGARKSLVFGGKLEGDFILESISESWDVVDNRGNLLIATVNITLKESVDA